MHYISLKSHQDRIVLTKLLRNLPAELDLLNYRVLIWNSWIRMYNITSFMSSTDTWKHY